MIPPAKRVVPAFSPTGKARMFGLPRAGNHAIAAWLLRNTGAAHRVLLNNCAPKWDPYRTAWQVEIDGAVLLPGEIEPAAMAAHYDRIKPSPFVLISYEQTLPWLGSTAETVTRNHPAAEFDWTVVIWRSFLNWLASLTALYLRQGQEQNLPPIRTAERILHEMRLYRDGLAARASGSDAPAYPIVYDLWVAEPNYRRTVLEALNLPGRDLSLGEVPSYGGGSSFDRLKNSAATLDTSRRWEKMLDHPIYQHHLRLAAYDDAFLTTLEQIFPKDAARLRSFRGGTVLAPIPKKRRVPILGRYRL